MAARTTAIKQVTFDETLAKLRDLEKADGDGSVEKDARGESEGEEAADEEEEEAVYEEEELEDETDYNLNYFDNGEDYGGDYDDGDGKTVLPYGQTYSSTFVVLVEGPIY